MSPLSLGDLVDLEARTLEEQGDSEEFRRSRYRQLGRRLAEQGPLPDDPAALLKALLRLDPRPGAPGRRFVAALRLVHIVLAIFGLLIGGSLTLGLIQNDDKHPANVLTVVFVLVGTQLLILALFLAALFPAGDRRASGPVQHLLLGFMHWTLRRLGVEDKALALQDRLDAHRGLLRWSLIRATQVFGVTFNVAVIATAMFRFSTTDIHFGWSTTIGVQPETVQHVARTVALPWSWIKPGAFEPTLAMVLKTEYSHLQGKFLRAESEDWAAHLSDLFAWYNFVVFAVFTYGFIPRMAFLMIASLRVRSILAGTPRNNVDLVRLCEWMRAPVVSTRPEGPDPAPHEVSGAPSVPEPPLPPTGSRCELVAGAPSGAEQALRNRFGWMVATGPDGPLVAVVSAWEEPTKGHLRKLADLRTKLANRILIVGLFDPSGKADARRDRIRDRWKRDLPKALDGVRVRVESL